LNNNILILGDGRLGSEIHNQTNWDIISRKKNPNIDFLNPKSYILNDKYDTIINCIAYTNTIDNNREKHWDINYKFVIDLVEECNRYGKKLIHISSDYIYSNSNQNANENDIPIHIPTWYVYTKLLSDAFVEAKSENYLTIRTSFKIKPWIHDTAWSDLIGNFDYIENISEKIIYLIKNDANGIFNVGSETKSIFDLAKQTKNDVTPVTIENNPNHIRPTDVTMNLNKYYNFYTNVDN